MTEKRETRVALVTGGAGGIGRAVAERLAREVRVVIADRDLAGEKVAREIGAEFRQADLARAEDCRDLVREILDRHGRFDILINNAGFQHIDPIEDFPLEKWEEMLRVMLTASFLLIQGAWPEMKKRGFGRIVNISSVHGLVASPFKIAYITAKHGMIGMTKTLALEGGEHGITVNAIAPAYVRTPLVEAQIVDQARTRGISEEEVIEKVMLEPAAVKRLIEPSEVAEMVAYLCSDAAAVVTGSTWTIDLGWTAR